MSSPKKNRLVALLAAAAAFATSAAAAPPARIVSLNLCADQYLIALADRGQIAALTRFARDPAMSWGVARGRTFPVARGSLEEILTLRPDLVFTAGFANPEAIAMLRARRVRVIDLPWDDRLDSIERTTRLVAAAIGHPARGERLIRRMRARIAALGPPPGRGRVAADYQRRGYLTGQGTLIDEMMRRAGLVNLAARLDRPVLSYLSIEEMAVARPDFLLLSNGHRIEDKGTEMLHHPLLNRVVPAARRIDMPDALTTCGGPSYPDAIARLVNGIRRADAKSGS